MKDHTFYMYMDRWLFQGYGYSRDKVLGIMYDLVRQTPVNKILCTNTNLIVKA